MASPVAQKNVTRKSLLKGLRGFSLKNSQENSCDSNSDDSDLTKNIIETLALDIKNIWFTTKSGTLVTLDVFLMSDSASPIPGQKTSVSHQAAFGNTEREQLQVGCNLNRTKVFDNLNKRVKSVIKFESDDDELILATNCDIFKFPCSDDAAVQFDDTLITVAVLCHERKELGLILDSGEFRIMDCSLNTIFKYENFPLFDLKLLHARY